MRDVWASTALTASTQRRSKRKAKKIRKINQLVFGARACIHGTCSENWVKSSVLCRSGSKCRGIHGPFAKTVFDTHMRSTPCVSVYHSLAYTFPGANTLAAAKSRNVCHGMSCAMQSKFIRFRPFVGRWRKCNNFFFFSFLTGANGAHLNYARICASTQEVAVPAENKRRKSAERRIEEWECRMNESWVNVYEDKKENTDWVSVSSVIINDTKSKAIVKGWHRLPLCPPKSIFPTRRCMRSMVWYVRATLLHMPNAEYEEQTVAFSLRTVCVWHGPSQSH